jgi:hypothetical protein
VKCVSGGGGRRILEVGVGNGLSLPCYPPDCRVVGVDVSRDMLEVARARAASARLLSEMCRVCVPGGDLVLVSHFAPERGPMRAVESALAPCDERGAPPERRPRSVASAGERSRPGRPGDQASPRRALTTRTAMVYRDGLFPAGCGEV